MICIILRLNAMKMKKSALFRACLPSTSLLLSGVLWAAPIQQVSLSDAAATDITPTAVAISPTAQATTPLWELRQSVEQLQNEVRQLRGQLEEKDNQLEQLNQDLKSRYDDLDQRLELLNKKVDPEAQNEEADNSQLPATAPAAATAPRSAEVRPAAPNTPPPATPTKVKAPASANTAAAAPKPKSAGPAAKANDDQAAYELAYQAYQQGGAAKAIQPMKNFVQNYPESPYRSHGYYWLGEFSLSINPPNFKAAKNYFSTVANRYPQSSKAPVALYRLAEISKNIEHNAVEAKTYYRQLLQKYPQSSEAKRAKTESNL
jgi:tol-pal system protein YbgF